MVTVYGYASKINFVDPDTGYAIVSFKNAKGEGFFSAKGTLFDIRIGDHVKLVGEWKSQPKWPDYFQADTYDKVLPGTEQGAANFLKYKVKGIGKKKAEKILATFGARTLEIINDHPEELINVPGFTQKTVDEIREVWNRDRGFTGVMARMYQYGLSAEMAKKIYDHCIINQIPCSRFFVDPYWAVFEIRGVGFSTIDEAARNMGISKYSETRLQAGIKFVLEWYASQGHCFACEEELIENASAKLDVDKRYLKEALDAAIDDDRFVRYFITVTEGGQVLLPDDGSGEKAVIMPESFDYYENDIAFHLFRIMDHKNPFTVTQKSLKTHLGNENCGLHIYQKEAVLSASSNKVMILTGGPGTGKTTVIKEIIGAYKTWGRKYSRKRDPDIFLCAPTGRAAKRMSESTGENACTIHRLLEVDRKGQFVHNYKNPLRGDLLIVDESSMIDTALFKSLIQAVPDNMTVILVGDTDQLPSVGAGNVLRDLIDTGLIPTIRLTHNFRQNADSRIVTAAINVNEGKMPDITNKPQEGEEMNFFFKPAENKDIADFISEMVTDNLPRFYGCSIDDIQVLSPMKRGASGTVALNRMIQDRYNKNPVLVEYGGNVFRSGDRVIQLKNDYDKGVFNGDTGYVDEYVKDPDGSMRLWVTFEGRGVAYKKKELEDLTLAYAITVHKSQGSEYPVVVMPVTKDHWIMLQRNLLYTGITRAKDRILLVGDAEAIAQAVGNYVAVKRNTLLKQKIQARFEVLPFTLRKKPAKKSTKNKIA